MKQATYFIEVIKRDGIYKNISPVGILHLNKSLQDSKNLHMETIAIFKIYPHPKPAIAHFDNDLNAVIIE